MSESAKPLVSVMKTEFDNAFRVIIKNGEYNLQLKKEEVILYLNIMIYQSYWVGLQVWYVHTFALLYFLHTLLHGDTFIKINTENNSLSLYDYIKIKNICIDIIHCCFTY